MKNKEITLDEIKEALLNSAGGLNLSQIIRLATSKNKKQFVKRVKKVFKENQGKF